MSPKGFWFILITFFVIAANPGNDDPVARRLNINGLIQCEKVSTSSDLKKTRTHHLILKPSQHSSVKRKLVVDDSVDLEVNCFWKANAYRCEWTKWYYIEFFVDEAWSPATKTSSGDWMLFSAKWAKGPNQSEPIKINCGQRLN